MSFSCAASNGNLLSSMFETGLVDVLLGCMQLYTFRRICIYLTVFSF
jgi:hypothetical protein